MFFFWIILIILSLFRFWKQTKSLVSNKPLKIHLGVFVIALVPILIIFLSTPVSCCVGNSSLIHPLGEILPSSGKVITPGSGCINWVNKNGVWVPRSNALVVPSSKILVPRAKISLHSYITITYFLLCRKGKNTRSFLFLTKNLGQRFTSFYLGMVLNNHHVGVIIF